MSLVNAGSMNCYILQLSSVCVERKKGMRLKFSVQIGFPKAEIVLSTRPLQAECGHRQSADVKVPWQWKLQSGAESANGRPNNAFLKFFWPKKHIYNFLPRAKI